jgi:RNA polymerase sigma-70 factor (ECF subfamily)
MPRKSTYSDKKILKAVHTRGEAGWDLLFAEFGPMIKAIVRWRTYSFSEEIQKDVYQNIHKHLLKAIPRFKQESSLSWYIKTIAKNECVNEIRRQRRMGEIMVSSIRENDTGKWHEMEFFNPDSLNPQQELIQRERIDMVRGALQELQKLCKESISMFYLQQLTYKEMSDRLGISQNTVGSRLSKCLDKLHKELKKMPQYERERR